MIEDLILRARRRFVLNEALGQLAFASAVAIGGLALILILGTSWLEWWTLSLFAAIGIATGAWRVWKLTPDRYTTAVRLDQNAGLSDALSTALYFSRHSALDSEFQRKQRALAESAARSLRLESALPFTFPRTLYAMAGCAVLASGLLILRLVMGHGLDLRPPITEVIFEDQAANQAKQKKGYIDPLQRRRLEAAESLLAKLGVRVNPDDKQDAALDKAIEEALDGAPTNPGDQGKKGPGAGKAEDGKAGNGLSQSPQGDPMDKQSDGAEQNGEKQTPSGQQGPAGDKGASKNGNNGENSQSLLSKLKDAVSNMFSKPQDKQNAAKGSQQQNQAKSEKGSGEKGSTGQGQDQQGQQQADAESGDPNGDAKDGQQAEGKAGSKSAESSAKAGSGVGSQDGAKELRAAEQLKAMGKISEIIGKRAATVTGETTIEVQSGNQQLRTSYSSKSAAHGEADSDVTRDEIPVELQSYVQQYFEQVRKPAAPKAQPKAK